MAVNDLTFTQISTLLNSIIDQATGQTTLAPTNAAEFITVGQSALKTSKDLLMNSISQVLSKTIISNRPYTRKFKGLEVSQQQWGAWDRKISFVDRDFQDNQRLPLTDGVAIDDQKFVMDHVVQTNFYGKVGYEQRWSITRDQLYDAFQGPDQFASFISGKLQVMSDQVEQKNETLARAVICNLIAGTIAAGNKNQVVHLLTEYNAATGLDLTNTTVFNPDNYPNFIKWVYARIAAVSSMLTERSSLYHFNLKDSPVMRHTPEADQRVFMFAPNKYQIDARVLSDVYHDNYLKKAVTEVVNYWQSIQDPSKINITPVYPNADGEVISGEAVTINNVFCVIMDRMAAGYTIFDQHTNVAPYNAAGDYQNYFMKWVDRYINSFDENAVVFLLD